MNDHIPSGDIEHWLRQHNGDPREAVRAAAAFHPMIFAGLYRHGEALGVTVAMVAEFAWGDVDERRRLDSAPQRVAALIPDSGLPGAGQTSGATTRCADAMEGCES